MGFRNPLSSISGDQVTPGTITGSVVQTATTGQRVVIASKSVSFYPGPKAGEVGDPAPAQMFAEPLPSGGSMLSVVGTPGAGVVTNPSVSWYTHALASGANESVVDVKADRILLNGQSFWLPGEIKMWGGSSGVLPPNWVWCDGTAYDRTVYWELFAVLGTSFNYYDPGPTKFVVPILTGGRGPVGTGGGFFPGDYGGEMTHTLTIAEMPVHDHQQYVGWSAGAGTLPVWDGTSNKAIYGVNPGGSRGGGAAHNNMPPYQAVTFIIYTGNHS
jgi:microcystin-dependent protein